jgi:hypothetical protein
VKKKDEEKTHLLPFQPAAAIDDVATWCYRHRPSCLPTLKALEQNNMPQCSYTKNLLKPQTNLLETNYTLGRGA